MRHLATIQIIENLSPIEWADLIELAHVKGWQVIVKKWEYKIWDEVIYCEIDSFLPIRPEYEFLRKSSYKNYDWKEWFRIKTMKMKGVISQWLILPKSLLNWIFIFWEDVSSELWVIKYDLQALEEKKINETQKSRVPRISKYSIIQKIFSKIYLWFHRNDPIDKEFPKFIPKTDEERVQNIGNQLTKYAYKRAMITEKLEWCSATYYIHKNKFWVCSRNIDLQKTKSNHYWKIAEIYEIEKRIRTFDLNIAIQWEIIWPWVEWNIYWLKNLMFFVHNIYLIDKQRHLDPDELEIYCNILWLDMVPILEWHHSIWTDYEKYIEVARWFSRIDYSWKEIYREWIVIRTYDERFSFKSVDPIYLNDKKND